MARRCRLAGRNQRALLTLLLLHVNEAVSTERLVDQLWGEHPPRTATTSLQNTVAQLRKLLGPGLLHTRPAGYVLELDREQLDLARFERLSREARNAEPPERARLLREALALWRGSALADSELEDFAQPEIHRLEDLRLGVLEEPDRRRSRARAPTRSLVAEIEALVRATHCVSGCRPQLMLALYRCGRQAEALYAYHDARRTLVEELGIEPGPELQALYGSILRQERSLVRVAPPSLEDHYDEVLRAFSAGRLVPVLGPGVGGVAGDELATLLAARFELDDDGRGLAYVSQAVAARNGIGPLHDELHLALDRDFEPSLLHTLARRPAAAALRRARLPQQLIVSTSFDTGVERAFEAAGEELDVVVYVASGRDRGKFLHIAPERRAAPSSSEPNAYTGSRSDERSVLLKIHGHVDRGAHARARELRRQRGRPHRLSRPAPRLPVPCRSSSQRGCAAATCSSSAMPSTTGACASSFAASGGSDRLAYRSWAVQPAAQHARPRALARARRRGRTTLRSTSYSGAAGAA